MAARLGSDATPRARDRSLVEPAEREFIASKALSIVKSGKRNAAPRHNDSISPIAALLVAAGDDADGVRISPHERPSQA